MTCWQFGCQSLRTTTSKHNNMFYNDFLNNFDTSVSTPPVLFVRISFGQPSSYRTLSNRSRIYQLSGGAMQATYSVASRVRLASWRTLSAPTANPRPDSPARAASIAALSARRLVWLVMSLIVWMISDTLKRCSSVCWRYRPLGRGYPGSGCVESLFNTMTRSQSNEAGQALLFDSGLSTCGKLFLSSGL